MFDCYSLNLDKNCESGTFVGLLDNRLGIVITKWEGYIFLQNFSTLMKTFLVL